MDPDGPVHRPAAFCPTWPLLQITVQLTIIGIATGNILMYGPGREGTPGRNRGFLPDRSTDPLQAASGGREGVAVLISIATAEG